ncbi:hypothetical protein F443_21593 [Phytophthora nicotianae P1569]|uniref:Uncharacterized protein n=2 Tax=Phytophthora nicotianae TaxID=4792 RepID=V9DZK8_PHYNI|nr:hypothetical protein F443_21593 [Phytophthora nicotianae P1569]
MPRASSTRTTPRKDVGQRFIFLDLDSLLCAVRNHVLTHENQFHKELASFSSDVALCPNNLTVLLNDQHPSRIQCWRGTYCNPNAAEAKTLEAVRSDGRAKINWKLTQNGTPQHPTLEKMLKRHLTTTTGAKKTLVLATGALTKGLKSCVDAYLKAQWHVQLVTLDSCYKKSDWQFTQLDGFHVKNVDKYLKKLLTAKHCETPSFERKVSPPTLRPEHNNSCISPVKPVTPPLPPDYYDDKRAGMLEQELGDIERRKARLTELPTGKYAAGNRQRHVFMNLDNIAGAVCNSLWLYQRIAGARSGYDVRLNFRALTDRVCGSKIRLLKRRLASYRKMPRELALPLQEFDWEIYALSQSSSGINGLYYVLLDLLETTGSAKHQNTLVLVMSDGALGGSGAEQTEATKELLTKFLEKNWFVVTRFERLVSGHTRAVSDEEEVWVEPVWPSSHRVEEPVLTNSPVPQSPPQSAWGATAITTLSLFPTTPVLTMEQKLEQKMRLEDERKDLLERLRKNQEALNVLELETWSMQIPQQQELTRVAQQASDKQLGIRMAEEEEMQLKLLQEYEKAQEEEPWTWA